MLLDQADGILVECRASDLDARWRAKPVQNPRPPLAFALLRVDDERVLVAALVAAEPELRQDYFLFWALAVVAAAFLAGAAFALVFAAGAFAFTAAGFGLVAAAAAAVRFASATCER